MQILHLVNEGLAGGVLRVAYEQAIHLEELGCKSIVVTGYPVLVFRGFPNAKNYYKLDLNPRLSSSTPFRILVRALCTRLYPLRLPDGYRPDWVICHNFGLVRDGLRLKRDLGSRLAVMLHNSTFPSMLSDYMTSRLGLRSHMAEKAHSILADCDMVLTTSRNMQSMIRKLYGVDSQVVYPGCRSPPEVPVTRGDFVLCASRLSLGKRVDVVAQIISMIDDNVKVVFAGSTHETTRLAIKRIRGSGIKNYEIVPNVTEAELKRLYTCCRAFVSVGAEPFGLNQMEAASHGAPMVCNISSGASELFEDEVHGYLLRHNGVGVPIEGYADKVKKLIEDERLAWRMGYNAWKLCHERYTWERHARKLLQIIGCA